MSQTLNPMTLPLEGHHLIEASAGTGKTWTIASLYLRLVLGIGGPQGQALRPRQILVLTFTRAATQELVDRIRSRLVQAWALFEGTAPPEQADPFLTELLASVPEGAARREAAWRLEQAATGMDDAAVMTIDAWVQRLLGEHLLPAGQPGIAQLLESDEAWMLQAVRDYWRQQVYPLDTDAMQAVADVVASADELAEWLSPALKGSATPPAPPSDTLQGCLGAVAQHRAQILKALQSDWHRRADDIEAWFAACLQANPKTFNGNVLRDGLGTVKRWCDGIRAWSRGQSAWLEGVNTGKPEERRLRERLTPEGLLGLHNKANRPSDASGLPAWAADFERLVQGLDGLQHAHEALALHALGWVAGRLQQVKQERAAHTFDDLLAQALHGLTQSPEIGERLCRQYPAAMVDEFQDTSPTQLQLLQKVYRREHAEPHALLLIGDPKQSIYRFRGADIHGYLHTRRHLAQHLYSLNCNRRSVEPLVRAVNRLFAQGEERHSTPGTENSGAFLHGPDVPFEGVHSQGPKERLVDAKGPLPVWCAWTEPLARTPGQGRSVDAARAAERMAHLLSDPCVGFRGPEGQFRRLRPQDCCVLVRSRSESDAIRLALSARGIPSAYLSERESVLQSDEAADVLELLRALLEPNQLHQARLVWACASMALPLQQQLDERNNDALWDQRIQRLQHTSRLWHTQGVLSAIRHFIQQEGLAARALASARVGERRLTNWMHLAEWLHGLSEIHRTPAALVRAYAALWADPGQALQSTPGLREATLLRLESDQDVVQVVTIHKSKGLQYPVVWLPFGVGHREERRARPAFALLHQDGRWQVQARAEGHDQGDGEGEPLEVLREDVRLLYVALTRAVHQVWLGACPRKPREKGAMNWHQTALGHLISGVQPHAGPQEVVQSLLAHWDARHAPQHGAGTEAMRLEVLDPDTPEPLTMWQGAPSMTDAPPDERLPTDFRPASAVWNPVQARWRVASYSALAQGAGSSTPDWRDLRWDEAVRGTAATADTASPQQGQNPWHGWASSAAFGQFLHECLEAGAAHGFASRTGQGWQPQLQAMLKASEWAPWASDIERWLVQAVTHPVLPGQRSIAGQGSPRAELEFWMPMERIDTQALDRLLQQHLWPGQPRPPLRPQQVQGLLMGYADLVFESQGRYEVLDYKSNRLGDGPQHYDTPNLRQAVLEHRYDLQAALYLLALHRLLAQRLGPRYQMKQHLGAAHFMFLRGIDHPGGGVLSINAEPEWLLALDALLGQDSASSAGAGEGSDESLAEGKHEARHEA